LAEWIDRFVLMRRKADVLGDTLPPCTSRIVRVHMDARERAFYQALLRAAVRAYAAFVAAGRGDPARPRMFGAVLAWVARLRQACDHPLLAMGRRSVRLCLGAFASRERARAGDASWHATCEPDDENDGGDEAGDDADARCRCCARPVRGGPVLRHRAVLWAKASCGHLLCGVCAGAAAPSPRDALSDGVRASEDEGNGAPGGAIPLGRLPYEGACPPCVALRRWAADPAFHGPDDKGTEEEEKDATADDPKRGVATVPTSAKMRALVAYCRKALGADATSRIVVFSQWTACLDVAEALLRSVGIGCVRYDGDLNGVARRSAVLAAFSPSCSPAPSSSPPPPPPRAVPAQRPSTMRLRSARVVGTPPETRVLLASLHCAGVGLDLSAANHVVLLDAWYNPFIEQQACDRVHRIGQTRPVTVVRLHAAGTVETDVHRIQQRKLKEARAMGLAGAVAPPRCSAPADALPATGAGDDACEPDAPLRTDETDGSEADIHEIFRRVLRRCRVTVRKRRRTDGDGDDDRQERREEQHDQGTPRCRDGRKRPRADRDPLSAEDR
jgi:SNF2 family DNA or RNA helicase